MHDPAVVVAPWNVSPAGSGSTTSTPTAVDGPSLRTLYLEPDRAAWNHRGGHDALVIPRSDSGAVAATAVDALSVGSGSLVDELSTA